MEEVLVGGITSRKGYALGFNVLTNSGVHFQRLPISALAMRQDAPHVSHQILQLWNCFSEDVGVIVWDYLLHGKVKLKDGRILHGEYLFTVDYAACDRSRVGCDLAYSDEWKCHHILLLEDGNLCAYPNNRIAWQEASFITKPFPKDAGYKTMTRSFECEMGKWKTADENRFLYKIKDLEAEDVSTMRTGGGTSDRMLDRTAEAWQP